MRAPLVLLRTASPILLLAACGAPELPPIDNALLAWATEEERATIAERRAERDRAEDESALAQRDAAEAEKRVEVAKASLRTVRAQVEESKLAVELARDSGSPSELEDAEARHAHTLARAEHARQSVSVRKRELEVARLRQKRSLEEHRLSLAKVELAKAEALRDVDLVEARSIPVEDYRAQVEYHAGEVETARERLESAQERLGESRRELASAKKDVDELDPDS